DLVPEVDSDSHGRDQDGCSDADWQAILAGKPRRLGRFFLLAARRDRRLIVVIFVLRNTSLAAWGLLFILVVVLMDRPLAAWGSRSLIVVFLLGDWFLSPRSDRGFVVQLILRDGTLTARRRCLAVRFLSGRSSFDWSRRSGRR